MRAAPWSRCSAVLPRPRHACLNVSALLPPGYVTHGAVKGLFVLKLFGSKLRVLLHERCLASLAQRLFLSDLAMISCTCGLRHLAAPQNAIMPVAVHNIHSNESPSLPMRCPHGHQQHEFLGS